MNNEGKPPEQTPEEPIPDKVDETIDYPRTIQGKILEMKDIGAVLIDISDRFVQTGGNMLRAMNMLSQNGLAVNGSDMLLLDLIAFSMKMATLVQLHTECLEQLYHELRGPE